MSRTLLENCRACTLVTADDWGLIEDAAIVWRDATIEWIGPRSALPATLRADAVILDGAGWLLTPALIDCHTHLVFAGERIGEYEQRLSGVPYAQIAASGGGILATVRATRAADAEQLLRQSLPRARALIADGVATLEIKSGYGLEPETELRMLAVAHAIGSRLGVDVRRTFLAAHALPPEYHGRADDYVTLVCERMLPEVAARGLADAVDAFCEQIAFSPAQTARVFAAARHHGLRVKLHADQLSNLHGAALAAEHAALSADHLEYTDEHGVRAMAAAGTVAVLLPAAYFVLRETQRPPIAALRRYRVPIAVASDCNPGSAPLLSLRLALAMACTLFALTPLEAVRAATINAARALGLHDRGQLLAGMRADLALWDLPHPAALAYWLGGPGARRVYCAGRQIHPCVT